MYPRIVSNQTTLRRDSHDVHEATRLTRAEGWLAEQ